jgi:colicin import membrane protein|tara:strand:+ start:7108 stop:7890 length:783 start_codon:yes stop_codon:yes gene_type:complete
MNAISTYSLPILLALVVHAGIAALVMMNFESKELPSAVDVEPYYIEASVVDKNPHTVEKEQKKQKKQKAQNAKASRDKARRLAKAEKARQDKINRDKLNAAKIKSEALIEQERIDKSATAQSFAENTNTQVEELREQERIKMEDSLSLAIMDEQVGIRAVTDDEKAMAFVSQIQREIIQNWSRPPSARNGMQALLRVYLVPTGEVVNVVLEQSSGNDAFDRSALLAVRKAERFVVPTQSRQFERNFREFEVLFRPEDLRL